MIDQGDAQRPPQSKPEEAGTLYMGDRPGALVKTRTLGEGITTAGAEQVIYLPLRELYPVGLGQWVSQRRDLAAEFPTTPGSWIKKPSDTDMQFLVVKESRTDPVERGALTNERASLLQLNSLFPEDAVARPPILYGYGVRKKTGNPYLVLENFAKELPPYNNDFLPLDEHLSRPMAEEEALDIAERIGFVLNKAHANDIAHNDVHNLKNIFWDRQTKQLRLIDWGNSAFPKRFKEQGFNNNFSFNSDRHALARVLFQLVAGRPCPANPKKDITHNDWGEMSLPTRYIIAKGLYLTDRTFSYLSNDASDTTRMFNDLRAAKLSLPKAAA